MDIAQIAVIVSIVSISVLIVIVVCKTFQMIERCILRHEYTAL
jgi:hypothetical protein